MIFDQKCNLVNTIHMQQPVKKLERSFMNMNKLAITTAVFALLISGTLLPAFASTDASPSTVRDEAKETKKEFRSDRQELRSDAAKKRSDALTKHCAAVETSLTNILSRVDSRIAKQKAIGKDVSVAETAATEARSALKSGKTYCAQAVAKFDSVPADKWETQKAVLVEARALAKQSREMFVQARKAITSAIKNLVSNAKKIKAVQSPTSNIEQ